MRIVREVYGQLHQIIQTDSSTTELNPREIVAFTANKNAQKRATAGKKVIQECRHTYCTNMALAGMNPKTLQYLMGHSEIGVTLDVYTHVSFEDARDEVEKMNIV